MAARDKRARLDTILVERRLVSSRARAQALILSGRVRSGPRRLDKPGTTYPRDLAIDVVPGRTHVSRGGIKLEGALRARKISVAEADCLDVGASTGGFTEALLRAGARRVIALDVGRGQLDWTLRQDPRVHVVEGVNARRLVADQLPFRPTFAVVDVSFISLELVLPAVAARLVELPGSQILALVKPQFEVGRRQVGRGGIVRDPQLHREVLERLLRFATDRRWGVPGLCASPITGADGNREFFLHLAPNGSGSDRAELDLAVEAALGSERQEEIEP